MATVALTYEQIAQRLGITVPSVRRMVNRHRWRKTRANDGRTLVNVPEEYLAERDAARETAPVAASMVAPTPALEAVSETVPEAAPVPALEADLLARLASLQDELVEMARRAGAAEVLVEEMRVGLKQERAERLQERERADHLAVEVAGLTRQLVKVAEEAGARERDLQVQLAEHMVEAERVRTEAERQAAIAREKADNLVAQLNVERRRADELCQERDQVLERLDRAVERLDRVQAEHHAEVMAVREQMARAEHDHDRVAAELAAHLALPWWRRLFA